MPKELILTILTREKYFRKQLSDLIKIKNVTQVLILGSGLDSLAARKRHYSVQNGVRFFEVDRKESLELKQEILENLPKLDSRYKQVTQNATYISADYTNPFYIQQLIEKGFSLQKPTLVIWGGNTMYLERKQIHTVLVELKAHFSTTPLFVAFDYLHPASVDFTEAQKIDKTNKSTLLTDLLSGMKNKFGVTFKTGFAPTEIEKFCTDLRFSIWNNRNHLTAASHATEIGVENEPAYTESHYSYITITNQQ